MSNQIALWYADMLKAHTVKDIAEMNYWCGSLGCKVEFSFEDAIVRFDFEDERDATQFKLRFSDKITDAARREADFEERTRSIELWQGVCDYTK